MRPVCILRILCTSNFKTPTHYIRKLPHRTGAKLATPNFRELLKAEVQLPRITLPRTPVNKGHKEGPELRCPTRLTPLIRGAGHDLMVVPRP
jgi:hypothetical protein